VVAGANCHGLNGFDTTSTYSGGYLCYDRIQWNGTQYSLKYTKTSSTTTPAYTKVTVPSAYRVGIGETSPDNELDVAGAISATGNITTELGMSADTLNIYGAVQFFDTFQTSKISIGSGPHYYHIDTTPEGAAPEYCGYDGCVVYGFDDDTSCFLNYSFCFLTKVQFTTTDSGTNKWCNVENNGSGGWRICSRSGSAYSSCGMMCF